MDREKEQEKPQFDIDDRDFNVKAWYLKNTEVSKGDALIEIRYKNKLIREFLFPAYKIWNIAAHFKDIVSGELSKDDKERGYRIAASTGLEGLAYEKKEPECPVCGSPLEDNGNCSDVGGHTCMYTGGMG